MTLDITPYLAAAEASLSRTLGHHAWRHQQPLPADALTQGWQQLCQRTLPPNKRTVYVHIPFCATHCTFCGFYQNRFSEQAIARYFDYLQREIDPRVPLPLQQSAPIHAIYLGGGTPVP